MTTPTTAAAGSSRSRLRHVGGVLGVLLLGVAAAFLLVCAADRSLSRR
ncbi:hypothetical protein [Streptomyces sp. NPDC048584]